MNLKNLEMLQLAFNLFNGPLPTSLANLKNMVILDLSHNFLLGQIPANIGEMDRLVQIRLNNNVGGDLFGFSGPIPASIGLLNNLVRLDLHKNRLTGTLPRQLGFLNNLRIYNIEDNEGLVGTVPEEYQNLPNLEEFLISGTAISGVVPGGLCEREPVIEVSCVEDLGIVCSCCTCAE